MLSRNSHDFDGNAISNMGSNNHRSKFSTLTPEGKGYIL